MAKLPRVLQKIFSSAAANNGIFGSADANGGPGTIATTIADIQSLPAFAQGWLDATTGAKKFPCLEEIQGLQWMMTQQLAYLFQQGIPEYDATTTYYHYSICIKPGTFQIYGSLIDNNTGNALTVGADWQLLIDLAATGGAPNIVTLTGASGNYNPTAGTKYLRFRMVGGAGGGGSTGQGGNTGGTMGGTSSFGTFTCIGGSGGLAGGGPSTDGGQGGPGGSGGVGTGVLRTAGSPGFPGGGVINSVTPNYSSFGAGGSSIFGPGAATAATGAAGNNAAANTGAGGGAAGAVPSSTGSAGGGGAGEGLEGIIANPVGPYAYVIGAGGAGGVGAGTDAHNGGTGAAGMIIIEEHF